MKRVFYFLLCLSCVVLCGKEPWHEPEAAYRMVVELQDGNKDGFWVDSHWVLPCKSGFNPVIYADGKKMPGQKRGVIPKSGGSRERILYFGYPGKHGKKGETRAKDALDVIVRSIEGKNGEVYPVIRWHLTAPIALDRTERINLFYLEPVSPGNFSIGGMTLPGYILLKKGEDLPLEVKEKDGKFHPVQPFARLYSARYAELRDFNFGLKLLCSDYAYCQESETASVQFWSSLPKPVLKEIQICRNGGVMETTSSSQVVFPAEDGRMTFTLKCSSFEVDSRRWSGIPVDKLPELTWKRGLGFFTAEGEQVTILLTRPDLHRLRKWEGWNKFCYMFKFNPSVLKISAAAEPDALCWPEESPLQNGLLKFHKTLLNSEADELQLVLPRFAAIAPQEEWKRERALAALFELISKNPNFLKCSVGFQKEPAEENEPDFIVWREAVRRLCREYNLPFSMVQ